MSIKNKVLLKRFLRGLIYSILAAIVTYALKNQSSLIAVLPANIQALSTPILTGVLMGADKMLRWKK